MLKRWARLSLVLFATPCLTAQTQTPLPASIPNLKYPPIARAAKVQGDVVVSFRLTAQGDTADVTALSGPAMLQSTAVENVKAWRFDSKSQPANQPLVVTFHFQLNPPDDG